MSKFSAATVGVLEYDFRSFPQDGSEERCTGQGIIPEPSKAKLKAFFSSFQELMQRDPLGSQPTDEEVAAAVAELDDKIFAMLSDVCSGKPSVDELKQLPPRILAAFTRYILEELAPKA